MCPLLIVLLFLCHYQAFTTSFFRICTHTIALCMLAGVAFRRFSARMKLAEPIKWMRKTDTGNDEVHFQYCSNTTTAIHYIWMGWEWKRSNSSYFSRCRIPMKCSICYISDSRGAKMSSNVCTLSPSYGIWKALVNATTPCKEKIAGVPIEHVYVTLMMGVIVCVW